VSQKRVITPSSVQSELRTAIPACRAGCCSGALGVGGWATKREERSRAVQLGTTASNGGKRAAKRDTQHSHKVLCRAGAQLYAEPAPTMLDCMSLRMQDTRGHAVHGR
jgi:hypothetical protein